MYFIKACIKQIIQSHTHIHTIPIHMCIENIPTKEWTKDMKGYFNKRYRDRYEETLDLTGGQLNQNQNYN